MKFNSKDSFKSLDNISSSGKEYKIFNLKKAEKNGLEGVSKLPKSLKVLLENLLRYEDNKTVDKDQILAIKDWLKNKEFLYWKIYLKRDGNSRPKEKD